MCCILWTCESTRYSWAQNLDNEELRLYDPSADSNKMTSQPDLLYGMAHFMLEEEAWSPTYVHRGGIPRRYIIAAQSHGVKSLFSGFAEHLLWEQAEHI